jgi:hypothetical protein
LLSRTASGAAAALVRLVTVGALARAAVAISAQACFGAADATDNAQHGTNSSAYDDVYDN